MSLNQLFIQLIVTDPNQYPQKYPKQVENPKSIPCRSSCSSLHCYEREGADMFCTFLTRDTTFTVQTPPQFAFGLLHWSPRVASSTTDGGVLAHALTRCGRPSSASQIATLELSCGLACSSEVRRVGGLFEVTLPLMPGGQAGLTAAAEQTKREGSGWGWLSWRATRAESSRSTQRCGSILVHRPPSIMMKPATSRVTRSSPAFSQATDLRLRCASHRPPISRFPPPPTAAQE